MTTPNVGTTSVDIQGMTVAQGNFQNAVDMCNTVYNGMTEQQGTLASNWLGETASTFGQALTQWLEDFNVVRQNLAKVLEALSQNTGIYANTQEGSQQAASVFQNALSGVQGLQGL